jgi:hypothetical protein
MIPTSGIGDPTMKKIPWEISLVVSVLVLTLGLIAPMVTAARIVLVVPIALLSACSGGICFRARWGWWLTMILSIALVGSWVAWVLFEGLRDRVLPYSVMLFPLAFLWASLPFLLIRVRKRGSYFR